MADKVTSQLALDGRLERLIFALEISVRVAAELFLEEARQNRNCVALANAVLVASRLSIH